MFAMALTIRRSALSERALARLAGIDSVVFKKAGTWCGGVTLARRVAPEH
jgi:hypothetical protein